MVRLAKLAKQFAVNPDASSRNFPTCQLCGGRSVDSAVLANQNGHSIDIVVKCHGAEDSCRIDFPYRLQDDVFTHDSFNWAVKRAMSDFVAFQSSHREK